MTCGGGKHSVKQYLPHPMHCPQHQLLLMMVLQVFITFTSPPALSSSTFSCPLLPLQQAIKVHNQHSTVDFRKRTIDMCVTIYVAKGYLFWIYYETKTCSALWLKMAKKRIIIFKFYYYSFIIHACIPLYYSFRPHSAFTCLVSR